VLQHFYIGMPLAIETPSRIEPCLLESIPIGITDLIANLTNKVRLCERSEPQSEPVVGQARW